MAEVWTKLCGCAGRADVEMALQAGADAFGMIFAPSPRRITLSAAAEISRHLPATIRPVAVFVDPAARDVDTVSELFPRALLQFSGDETPEFVQRYGDRAIKTLHVDAPWPEVETRARRFPQVMLLLDSRHRGLPGGTGVSFAWEQAAALARERPIVIAGGLNSNNVAQCLRRARPFGVDVRSGIETGGRKDPRKMRAFVEAVRAWQ